MDDQFVVCELQEEELEQVAGGVWADAEALGWFVVGVNVMERKGVVLSVLDFAVGKAMVVCRRVDLHRLKCNTDKAESKEADS